MHIQRLWVIKSQYKTNRWLACLLLIGLSFTVSGCALSEQRVHPEIETRANAVSQPVLIPPDVSMLELLPQRFDPAAG